MKHKAYIVANKEQELNVLNKLEQDGLLWDEGEKPTDWVPSKTVSVHYSFNFPYVLSSSEDGNIIWFMIEELTKEEIVYDGRKEENMDKKYKVTQEFMNELIEWRDDNTLDAKIGSICSFVDGRDIQNIPDVIDIWWTGYDNPIENNNRLIAIIQWLNGEDMFEVENPHKFVVRNDYPSQNGDYNYVQVVRNVALHTDLRYVSKFDTREEAQEWANSHQVVVEIDAEGNEVQL